MKRTLIINNQQYTPKEDTLSLWTATAVYQLFGTGRRTVWIIQRLTGLTPGLAAHVLRERRKMITALWFSILRRDRWTCYLQIHPLCPRTNWENWDTSIPKMEVDHIIPVIRMGYTEPNNLKTACKLCNVTKGTKLLNELPKFAA